MPVSNVNGSDLHWSRAGGGERLLFCNGSGATLADAKPLLDHLGTGFDLLAWDYRGFGQSGSAARPYTMADIAADVAGLLDLVGWDTCRIVGVSFGGMVALEFAATHPARVDRLALACTSAGGAGGSSYPLQALDEMPLQERAAARLKLTDSRWDDVWLATHPVDHAIAEALIGRLAHRDTASAAAHGAQLQARAGHDVWDRLGAIGCPTLVAYGRYDGIAPAANSEAIASRLPQAELRGYEGGHIFLLQSTVALPELVTFLQA
jgi:3-oxoadipate enol-lactonase